MLSSSQKPGVTNGKPTVVREYNKFLGGVDKADQHRSYYGVGHNSKKWWRTVFSFVINVCLVQAWIAWSNSPHLPDTKKYDHLGLRSKIASQLLAGFTSRKQQAGRRSNATVVVALESIGNHKLVRGTKRKCRQCLESNKKTAKGWGVQTSFMCKFCDAPLCRGACFRDFHVRVCPQNQ